MAHYSTGYRWGTGLIWGRSLRQIAKGLHLNHRSVTLKVGKMSAQREVVEGLQVQGADESIAYSLDITPWGSDPTDLDVTVLKDGTDVTSTVMTGTPTAPTATTILLPVLSSLTAGSEYLVQIAFTILGNDLVAYFVVRAEV